MTTSLPPDVALYHMDAKIFQRSKGRSAVAAAAYRSTSCFTDHRIGETFDYTKKHKVAAFILTPPDAPDWTRDRGELWNRVEAGEKRKDAQVAREVEVSIPRDIPESEWQAFAEEIAARYVEAGAVVDVAIHAPTAADKNPNPHLHLMLTFRALDESQSSGFASVKNAAIVSIFTSGGSYGGKRGDALKAERERIAGIANGFLERAGSARRVSHKSWADLGIDRVAEPTMGEERLKKFRRQKTHDRRTRLVQSVRASRIADNELTKTEEEIMATNASYQARNGIRPRSKADFKTRLLRERFPDLKKVTGWAEQLHFIDTSNPAVTKIATVDGGHIEIGNRLAKVYGQRGVADRFAGALESLGDLDHIERLEELKSIQRKGSGIRQRRNPDEVPALPAVQVESLADRWRSRGYHKITESPDGVWIEIGKCRIQDLGDELRIHGPVASDAAVRAMVEKAAAEWSSEVEIFGSKEFKDACWLEAQRQGVKVFDQTTGEEYQPSEELRRRFNADRARVQDEGNEIAELKRRKAMASLLLEAAAGDTVALTKLKTNDRDLADFVTLHLDDAQRGQLVGKPESDIVPALAEFRQFGKAARKADEDEKKRDGSAAPRHPLDFDPAAAMSPEDIARMSGDDDTNDPDDFTRRPK